MTEHWQEVFQQAKEWREAHADMHIAAVVDTLGPKKMVFFVERIDDTTKWHVIDQFRFKTSMAYATKKAAQRAIAEAGSVEAPMCKWGFFCDMGRSQHVHG
jgi:hypothetical protein